MREGIVHPWTDRQQARGRRSAPRRTPKPAIGAAARGLQELLGDAAQRVQRISAASRVVAWASRDGGDPYVAAAAFRGDPPVAPDASELRCLSTLSGVTPLDDGADRLALARRHGVSVALPIPHDSGEAAVVLLLGPERPAPRVLAQLKREAQRLRGPIASALAVARVERLDRSIQQLNRLASLGALATEIAHEIRNPLVSIKTFLQLLPQRWGDPEFSESFLELVAEELRRMERLLDVVIEHARPGGETADQRPADVDPIIAASLSLLEHRARKREVSLQASIPRDLPAIALGEDRLRQVLLNLLLNAIDATPPGGGVSVGAKRVGDFVEIAVCDDGPGVPPELRAEIFEPFFSTRAHSAGGLGLAIARRIVRDAGGELRVRARRAGGAEFALRIAAAERPDPHAARDSG